MTYGYCRVSTKSQDITRQIRNITEVYPAAKLYTESMTGTTMVRPEWKKLTKQLKAGDTVVFDSVSRMSRNAEEGIETYMNLFDRGIDLVFIKEPGINTATYKKAMSEAVPMTGTAVDVILSGINEYLRILATEQIRLAFGQSQKEVDDLRNRTKEGIVTARENGKQIGQKQGAKLTTKKSQTAKEIIRKHSKAFGGSLADADCQKLAGISRNSYYKYKAELAVEVKAGEKIA